MILNCFCLLKVFSFALHVYISLIIVLDVIYEHILNIFLRLNSIYMKKVLNSMLTFCETRNQTLYKRVSDGRENKRVCKFY